MKYIIIFFPIVLCSLSGFGQEIELYGSFNTSTEQRFQNAYGFGLQYQQDVGKKFKAELGVHYNFKNARFEDIPFIDGDPNLVVIDKISSHSNRFAFRLNMQGLLLNQEHISVSFGPEISYNLLWGEEQVDRFTKQTSGQSYYTQENGLTKEFGLGLISTIEIKKILVPHLSLCFTIRPELVSDGIFAKGGQPVFSGLLGFTEFQIGLKYRFGK